ncbi:hypothetical protein LshimejAT787_1801680 [Lyophyllum shimeji]|uniref:Uncharacterized protein n=1 Tax=Lyophyllum shimeji TaxID=47721 RepID=A0A9P3UW70_LYOSH|nr:hypothetical protein LshimejAT787_1801680 [Lyophyllum shimeji]
MLRHSRICIRTTQSSLSTSASGNAYLSLYRPQEIVKSRDSWNGVSCTDARTVHSWNMYLTRSNSDEIFQRKPALLVSLRSSHRKMPLDIKWQYDSDSPPVEPTRSRCEEAITDAATNYLSGFPADIIFVEATVRVVGDGGNTLAVEYKTAPQQRSGSHVPAELYLSAVEEQSRRVLEKVVWYPERRDTSVAELEQGDGKKNRLN